MESQQALTPLLPSDRIEVFVDGALSDPQLNHPEGICADSSGNLWCGGERGEIYRVDIVARTYEQVGSTNGFLLGLNFDDKGHLYVCDNKHKGIFRYSPNSGVLSWFTGGSSTESMKFPNYPLIDAGRNFLYVSDSYQFQVPGPGIWRVNLDTAETELWCREAFNFANGLALSGDGRTMYVAESWGRCVSMIPIDAQGNPGKKQCLVSLPGTIPDGLAITVNGMLYITSYEPSRIYRYDTHHDKLELVVEDPDGHAFCHPTNCVIVGDDLYASNLGRWHISKVSLGEV